MGCDARAAKGKGPPRRDANASTRNPTHGRERERERMGRREHHPPPRVVEGIEEMDEGATPTVVEVGPHTNKIET